MKSSKECVISFIESLGSEYGNLKFKYEYIELKGKHLIQIIYPNDELMESDIWEKQFDFSEYIEANYGETVLFLDKNSLSKIENVTYTKGFSEVETSININVQSTVFQNSFSEKDLQRNYILAA